MTTLVPTDRVRRAILTIRGKKVMIDADLAELYGVETRALNQAVRRNHDRFPDEFMFRLTGAEKQAVITDIEGWIGTVDFLWRAERVIAEVDSRWHDGPLDEERDEARVRRAEAAGYVVRRYRYRDLIGEPSRVHGELVVAMRRLTA